MSHKTQKTARGNGHNWNSLSHNNCYNITLTQASEAMTFTDLGQVPRKMVIKFNPGIIKPNFKHSFP